MTRTGGREIRSLSGNSGRVGISDIMLHPSFPICTLNSIGLSNKGDLNNYTLVRLSLHIKDYYGIFWSGLLSE